MNLAILQAFNFFFGYPGFWRGYVSIVSGDTSPSATDHTDFGKTPAGTPVSRIYTIANTGDADLNLVLPVTLTGADCSSSEFTVTAQPAASTVAANGTTTFTVQYNPADAGDSDTCTVTIGNDDSDENPSTFEIKGTEGIAKSAGWLPAVYRLLL